MGYSLKAGVLISLTVLLIALPLLGRAGAVAGDSPGDAISRSSGSPAADIDEPPLSLALSLSISSPVANKTAKMTSDNNMAAVEAEGEPLLIPLSLSLSLPSTRSAGTKDADEVIALYKDEDNGGSDPNSRASLFGDI